MNVAAAKTKQARQREVDGLVDVNQARCGGLSTGSRVSPLLGELSRGDPVEDH